MSLKTVLASFLQRLGWLATETAEEIQNLPDEELPPPPVAVPPTGTLVPLYTYPIMAGGLAPTWKAVIDAKTAHPTVPVIAVVNPSSGPGTKLIAAYVTGIAALKRAGIVVLGYVPTTYGARASISVQADIDKYRAWYPECGGIFFDEQANTVGLEKYYADLSAHARSKSLPYTVGNPGTDTLPSYVGTVDLILVHETAGLPTKVSPWRAGFDKKNFGMISYAVKTLDPVAIAKTKATANIAYLYVTDDVMQNPYDSVPPYFADLLGLLA